MSTPRLRPINGVPLVIGAPLLVYTAYLLFSRWPYRWFSGITDWSALGISILISLISLWIINISTSHKIFWSIILMTVGTFFLYAYTFYFIGVVFGDWL
jgi:hypothetical protein